MNKNFAKKMHVVLAILCVSAVSWLMTSCVDGFENNESFSSSVKNAQLESPELTDDNFSTVMNPDGTESVKVAWTYVPGAGGYEYKAYNVDDPANPVLLAEGSSDRTFFTFPKADDTKYFVSVRTLGDAANNNKEAEKATEYDYSTMVKGQIIPAGANIADFVMANIDKETTKEQAFELEAGATYTLDKEVDFGTKVVTFRGNKINRPIVVLETDGVIRTSAGLKVKWINFDCTASKQKGLIECSSQQYAEAAAANFRDITKDGKDFYYVKDPILIQECMVKNLHYCLFYSGINAYSLEDVRVDNCIIQMDNDGTGFGDAAVFCTYSGTCYYNGQDPAGAKWGSSIIRNITMKNTTIYNTKLNAKNRMVRFNQKSFGGIFLSAVGSATFENNTIIRIMSDKEFGNNTPNDKSYTINFNGNILCDVFRLAKFIQGSCTKNINPATNSDCWMKKSYAEDPSVGSDVPFVTREDDLMFKTNPLEGLPELDLTKPNGGVDFTVTGGTVAKTVGDPRWRE